MIGFDDIPFISLVCNREGSLKNIFFPYNMQLGEKKKTFTRNENLQGHLWHLLTCIAFLKNALKNLEQIFSVNK